MGNTVGNPNTSFCNFWNSANHAYILGLWCSDGYHRSSSIGLSNISPELIYAFSQFFKKILPEDRIRLKVYRNKKIKDNYLSFGVQKISVLNSDKAKHNAYHLYINSRPLLREFLKAKELDKEFLNNEIGWAYIAGRFDGDGTIGKDLRRDLRISYATLEDAQKDYNVLINIGLKNVKLYRYRTSSTYVLYISRFESEKFVKNCLPYSLRLQKLVFGSCRDLAKEGSLA